jgi:hypothetical protein
MASTEEGKNIEAGVFQVTKLLDQLGFGVQDASRIALTVLFVTTVGKFKEDRAAFDKEADRVQTAYLTLVEKARNHLFHPKQ